MIKTTISFTLGCVLLLKLPNLPSLNILWGLPFVLILLYVRYVRWLSISIIGAMSALLHSHIITNDIIDPRLVSKDITLIGTISSIPNHHDDVINFLFSPLTPIPKGIPSKIKLSWYKPLPKNLLASQQWRLTVRLKTPHGSSNPGSFNYEQWLFSQGIGATGYVRPAKSNQLLMPAKNYAINHIRETLNQKIEHALPNSPYIGLIQGLTTGVKHTISSSQWRTLQQSGTSHLLAISGLHIGLAAALGFYSCRWFWSLRGRHLLWLPAHHAGAIGGLMLALFYAAMAGFALPTQRALIMLSVFVISLLLKRPALPCSILALSALLIVIIDPLSILSAGFWLSFGAVALILFVSQHRYPKPRLQWLKIHGLLSLGLSPLLLIFFINTSIIAPLANSIAVPFVSLIIVPLVLLASILIGLIEPIGICLFQWAEYLLSHFWPLLDTLAQQPFSSWSTSSPPYWVYAILIISSVLLLSPRGLPGRGFSVFGLLPLLFFKPDKPEHTDVWLTLLDVGQGLSVVIQTQHHTLLYDTGPKFNQRFDSGQSIILPFFAVKNIAQLDTLIVSHGDNDHIGGATSIINAMPITTILTNDTTQLPYAQACISGMTWQWDKVTFRVLHPNKNSQLSGNNLSCVVQISAHGKHILLTGDIEKKAEYKLVKHYQSQLQSDVLVVPHHGSKTSSSDAFLNAVKPQIALFPVGFANRFNLPSATIVDRYHQRNISTWMTSDLGAISIKITKNGISTPMSFRKQQQKIGDYHPSSTE